MIYWIPFGGDNCVTPKLYRVEVEIVPEPEKIITKMKRLIDNKITFPEPRGGTGIVHYHEDGQSVTELGDIFAVTTDGEGRTTKECLCISYYGDLYSELCYNCNEWNLYIDSIETECSPNCVCKGEEDNV